jgi:hypothetical protein
MEYEGKAVGQFRGELTIKKLHARAGEKMQMSLLPVPDAIEQQQPRVLEPSQSTLDQGC